MNSKFVLSALLAGAVIRVAALPLPGTRDVGSWKIWTYSGAINAPTTLYGVGGSPPERRLLDFHGAETTVDYPPLALYELAAVGRIYGLLNKPAFPDNAALTAAIKVPLLLCDIGCVLIIFFAVRAAAGNAAARWAAIAYWLNPAPIYDASLLGYLDPLFMLPAMGAVFAGVAGWPVAAGALFAAAVLTKAQAVVLAPAIALIVWNGGPRGVAIHRLARAAAGGAAASVAIVAPVIAAGAWPNMIGALQSLTRHDMLSGNAPNLWWIVGYLLRARYSLDMGVWAAFTAPTKILAISRTIEIGYPNPRVIGTLLALGAMGWGVWTAARARDLFLLAAVSAFMVHAYVTLSAQVHENHLFAAIPLLVIAAAGRPRFRPILWTLSVIFALNLNLFYGVSEYIDGFAVPRTITIVDLTVLLALSNCVALAWHASVLRGECSKAVAYLQSPVPA